jgi:hypothetical protein
MEEGRSGRHQRLKERKTLHARRPYRSRPKTYTLNVVEGGTEGEPSEARDVQPLAQVGGEYQSEEIKKNIHPSPVTEATKAERFVSTPLELSMLIGPKAINAFLELQGDMRGVAAVESPRDVVSMY